MKVTTTIRHEVVLDASAAEEVFDTVLDTLCGGKDVYLNSAEGLVEEWFDTGHGSGITNIVDRHPDQLKLTALRLRKLLKEKRQVEADQRVRRVRASLAERER